MNRTAGAGLWGAVALGWVSALAAAASAQSADPNAYKVANGQAAPDLCAPCRVGAQCFSGVCTQDANNEGNTTCTQFCDLAANTCPSGFSCQEPDGDPRTICVPNGASVCEQRYSGALLDTLCAQPAQVSGASLDLNRPCAAPNVCFQVQPSQNGYCVQPCSRIDATIQCGTGLTCCYTQNSDYSCAGKTANVDTGGCFLIRQAGESCVSGQQSLCVEGTQCISPTSDPALAVCYRPCQAATDCIASESCVDFGGTTPVCCETATYQSGKPSTCRPASGICLRQVGVGCSDNSDCASGLCFKSVDGGVCSQTCDSDSDCPGPTADVNGDGVADGGASCLVQVGRNLCLPNGAIAAPPACATAASLQPGSGGGGGQPGTVGGCAQVGDAASGLASVAICAWLRRRGRRPS